MKHVIIGTAGHVDHGKTALIKALTGIETDRQEAVMADIVLTEGEDAMPRMNRTRLKAKKFTYYKLIFRSCSAEARCTVVAADVRVKYNIKVK